MESIRIPGGQTKTLEVRRLQPNLLFKERMRAKEEAKQALLEAQERARMIMQEAESEVERIHEAGREEGRQAGFREVAAVVAEATRWRTLAVEGYLPELADLAAEMARRILRRELALNQESVLHICCEVIKENRPGRKLTLHVHPEDLGILRGNSQPVVDDPRVIVEFEPSEQVDRGGCIVCGELGEVDGRLSVQLEELTRVLQEGCHGRQHP